MRNHQIAIGFLTSLLCSFPGIMQEFQGKSDPVIKKPINGILPGFKPSLQYVSNKGDHTFVPLNFVAGDVQGLCHGLNAAAIHGYIPYNGVGNHAHFL